MAPQGDFAAEQTKIIFHMKPFFTLWLLCLVTLLKAQQTPVQTPGYTTTKEGDGYRFTPQVPPLPPPTAGAPPAFYTYYWEFGDGDFSFEERPLHYFAANESVQPMLFATAHYDDTNTPPPSYAGQMYASASKTPSEPANAFPKAQYAIALKAQRQPRAGEELVFIISYRNLSKINTDGRLHLFFNEKKFPNRHFDYVAARTHYNETPEEIGFVEQNPDDGAWTTAPAPLQAAGAAGLLAWTAPPPPGAELLATARKEFRSEQIWRTGWMKTGETRNLFVSLKGTADMLRDTSAFIHLRGVFEPLDPGVPAEEFTLEIEIVSSHDPNLIAVSEHRVNFRKIHDQPIDYKVRFQNNGEGPARKIQLTIHIPEGLNAAKMRPLSWYPECPICPDSLSPFSCLDTATTKDALIFTFRNIYLPGSRQRGVSDYDSTQGFVRYRIEPDKKMAKLAFRSQAEIVFDKNPPIHTNFSKTRFKPGLSPGLKAGYAFPPDDAGNGYVFLGVSLSPYKSWKWYPQIELLTGLKGQTDLGEQSYTEPPTGPPVDSGDFYNDTVYTTTTTGTTSFVSFELPVLLRKNFTKFFGAGIGGSARAVLNFDQTTTTQTGTVYHYVVGPAGYILNPNLPFENLTSSTFSDENKNLDFRYSAFGDLTFGSVRSGLNIGVRGGLIFAKKNQPFVQVSLEYKL